MHDVRTAALVLLGAVLAVLLIACANVTSLFMARAAQRDANSRALGAGRESPAAGKAKMTEVLSLSIAGAAAGLVLAEVLLRASSR